MSMFNLNQLGSAEIAEFQQRGVLVLRDCIRPPAMDLLNEAAKLLPYKRKNIVLNGTRRRMEVCGGVEISNSVLAGPSIATLYWDPELIKALQMVSQQSVRACDDEMEWVISSRLNQVGDTHGWHYDDYPLAFILICTAPTEPNAGGDVQLLERSGETCSISLTAGDCYLMRSDIVRHRVTPLRISGQPRTMFNFTYSVAGIKATAKGSAHKLCA